jgi:hypothetical protein
VDDVVISIPEPGDAHELFLGLRHADYREVEAASGPQVGDAVERSVRISSSVYTVREPNGAMLCMFGTAPLGLLAMSGAPWMLGTNLLARHKRSLIKVARAYFDAMLDDYALLINYADARHRQSLMLLRGIGCRIAEAEPFGYAGLPFHRFWKERGDV